MKYTRIIFLILCIIAFAININAKNKYTETKYKIEGLEVGNDGTYLVKVFIYTKASTASIDEFKYAAVHGVIFKGFSADGFSAQRPLAEQESYIENKSFYDDFFQNGEFKIHANIITPNADRFKKGKEYIISAVVSVMKDNLRKKLEQAGVIRNLNSNF